jgi:signal transduction histidine kinase
VRWIGTYTDVTETIEAELRQRALEDALRAAKEEAEALAAAVQAANAALERRVEERTAELQAMQAELLKAERLSTLGQLTATVAHELNNPLGTIRNSMVAMNDLATTAGADVGRPVARMRRAIDRCTQIILELLDFTTVRELTCKPVRLDDWLGEVLDEQKLPAGIVLERRFGAPDVRVPIDLGRFTRVVANVIENGAEAIEEAASAERRIIVTTAVSDRARILIEDTGPGMPPDILAKVFEPLFSTKSFGTGLGLPTVKQIVQQHGGAVRIESAVGIGTRVEIVLPYADGSRLAA